MNPNPIDDAAEVSIPDVLPVLPLNETVVFPYVIVPLSVEPERGALAVDHALSEHRLVMLVAKRDASAEESPDLLQEKDLYEIGTVGRITRMLKLPDGRIRVLVQGLRRARLGRLSQLEPFLKGRVEELEDLVLTPPVIESAVALAPDAPSAPEAQADGDDGLDSESYDSHLADEALMRSVRDLLEKAIHMGKNLSPEVMILAANLEDPGRLADLAASNLELRLDDAQPLLETRDPRQRLQRIGELLLREIELLTMQHQISSQAQGEIDRSHREYFLRQQLKAIQQELGDLDELGEEIAEYRRQAEKKKMPESALEELEKQIRRLERSHPESGENTILRTYLDWLTSLPWGILSQDNLELDRARTILDEDHHGLVKIKERILELLAVRRLNPDSKGPILCFVGPPGVGKTSLGRSIARALGRKFARISLGGVRDEAEIRGHRRTYVGALPGRIIQGLHQAGTSNPVFMLDEIDKIGADYRGDPSSALLEVLDPEQNHSFRDHYLGVDYDLSQVIFITTANLLDPIQPAFLDRMEVLRLSGYTEEEKLTIARHHLLPKQRQENGLEEEHLHITEGGFRKLIRGYTREAGLRNLEREIAAVCRKTAVKVAGGRTRKTTLDSRKIETLLGPEQVFNESLLDQHRVGVATGLAWTATGGDLLLIEAIAVPGTGKLHLTGSLGEVMKESGQAALTYVRGYFAARPELLRCPIPTPGGQPPPERALPDEAAKPESASETGNINSTTADSGPAGSLGEPPGNGARSREMFSRYDIHIHAPAGSIPKDGPSAGITIATAIVSVFTGRPIDRELAMTGEITLRGEILPIGGLKEKALAARAAGIRTVIIPSLNEKDVAKLPRVVKRDLNFHCLRHLDEVLELAFVEPSSRAADPEKDVATVASSAAVPSTEAPSTDTASASAFSATAKPAKTGR